MQMVTDFHAYSWPKPLNVICMPSDATCTLRPMPAMSRVLQMMTDFHACSWPEPLNAIDTSLAAHFDQMNDEPVADVMAAVNAQTDSPGKRPAVITFSHFLPLQVLSSAPVPREFWLHGLHEKEYLFSVLLSELV